MGRWRTELCAKIISLAAVEKELQVEKNEEKKTVTKSW